MESWPAADMYRAECTGSGERSVGERPAPVLLEGDRVCQRCSERRARAARRVAVHRDWLRPGRQRTRGCVVP